MDLKFGGREFDRNTAAGAGWAKGRNQRQNGGDRRDDYFRSNHLLVIFLSVTSFLVTSFLMSPLFYPTIALTGRLPGDSLGRDHRYEALMENNVRVSDPILEAMTREAQRTGVDVNGLFDEAARQLLAHREVDELAAIGERHARRCGLKSRLRAPGPRGPQATAQPVTRITLDTNELISRGADLQNCQ